jgi:hypothetical protein
MNLSTAAAAAVAAAAAGCSCPVFCTGSHSRPPLFADASSHPSLAVCARPMWLRRAAPHPWGSCRPCWACSCSPCAAVPRRLQPAPVRAQLKARLRPWLRGSCCGGPCVQQQGLHCWHPELTTVCMFVDNSRYYVPPAGNELLGCLRIGCGWLAACNGACLLLCVSCHLSHQSAPNNRQAKQHILSDWRHVHKSTVHMRSTPTLRTIRTLQAGLTPVVVPSAIA